MGGHYDLSRPVEIAPDTFWVGSHIPEDIFQCHPYLIRCGESSVLIDPGSAITWKETLNKIKYITNPRNIRYIICHHQDPDVTGALPFLIEELPEGEERFIVTHWRTYFLLKHLALPLPFYLVDQHNFQLELEGGKVLKFILTPYMHYPGNIVTYDPKTKVLFSSDIFGGWMEDWSLFADETYPEKMRPYHEIYMPSRKIVLSNLNRLKKLEIEVIAPQHGSIIRGKELISKAFKALEEFDYGLMIDAPSIEEVKRKEIEKSIAKRILLYSLDKVHLDEILGFALKTLKTLLDISGIEVIAREKSSISKKIGEESEKSFVTEHREGDFYARVIFKLKGLFSHRDERLLKEVGRILARTSRREMHLKSMEKSTRHLRQMAYRDSLTGAYRRNVIEEYASRLFRKAKEEEQPFSCIMLDLDNFKEVNDTYGHLAGDKVLKEMADRIRNLLRREDMLIRYGGDEFIVLLPNTPTDAAVKVAARLKNSIEEIKIDGKSLSVSMGVAGIEEASSLKELIEKADEALYSAKRAGKSCIFAKGDRY